VTRAGKNRPAWKLISHLLFTVGETLARKLAKLEARFVNRLEERFTQIREARVAMINRA
jgi:hypothetical protein